MNVRIDLDINLMMIILAGSKSEMKYLCCVLRLFFNAVVR